MKLTIIVRHLVGEEFSEHMCCVEALDPTSGFNLACAGIADDMDVDKLEEATPRWIFEGHLDDLSSSIDY